MRQELFHQKEQWNEYETKQRKLKQRPRLRFLVSKVVGKEASDFQAWKYFYLGLASQQRPLL